MNPQTQNKNVAAVRRLYEARGNPDIVKTVLAPEVRLEVVEGFPHSGVYRGSNGGRIVNMSSGMGALSDINGGYAAYRISKAASNPVTGILAAELRGAVAVNSMCPGWVKAD